MARTKINPDGIDTLLPAEFSDTETTGSGMESSPTDLIDNLNNVQTMLREFSGSSDWFEKPSDNSNIFQTTSDNARQTFLFRTTILTDVTVTAAQNWELLSFASSETPAQTTATGAVTTEGAVCAFFTGTFNTAASTDEVTNGASALEPFNLCKVIDASTGDAITSTAGFPIEALLQIELNEDGIAFADSSVTTVSTRAQLSFVERNAGGTDLVVVPVTGDIAGKTINYAYVRRVQYQNLPEDAFLNPGVADSVAQGDITLSNAAGNQTGNVTYATKDINWVLPASGDHFRFEDGSSNSIATFELDGSGNGDVTLGATALTSDTTVLGSNFNVNIANTATVQAGLSVDAAAAGTTFNIGVTANQLDIAGNMTVTATSGSMTVNSTSADNAITTTTSGSVLVDGISGVEINSTGGALQIGNDANANAINIGNGAAARTITVGNATGATALDFDAGTGGITLDSISSDIVLTTTTSGNINLTAAGDVHLTAECHTIDVASASTGTLTVEADKVHFQNAGVGSLYPKLNADYTSTTAVTNGFVVAYDGTGTTDTVAAGGFTAGVDTTSDPTIATTAATGFAASDLILITGASNPCNNGLYEVVSHAANVLTVRSTNDGVTNQVEAFTDGQFVTDTTVAGAISGINVTVLQADATGAWGSATGSTTGFSFTSFGSAAGNSLQQAYVQSNAINVTSGEGIIDFSNDTNTDTTTVLSVARTPTASTAGTGLDVSMGANTTGSGVIIDQNGSGAALDVQDAGTTALLVAGSGAVSITPTSGTNATITSAGAGDVLVTAGDELDLTAAGLMDVNANASLDIDVTGSFDMLATTTFSIDGTGASNVTATSGNMTVSTLTTGNVVINAVDDVDMDATSAIAITAGTSLDIDAGTTVAVDAGTAGDASTFATSITGGVSSGAGNAAPSVTVTAGTPGAGGTAAPVTIALPGGGNIAGTDAVLAIDNGGTGTAGGHGVNVYVQDQAADPTQSAPAGSLAVVVNAATTPEFWLNDTSGTGAGTDWVRMATMDDVTSSDTLFEVITNQAGTVFTAGVFNTSWGIADGQQVEFGDSSNVGILTVAAAAAGDSVAVALATTAAGATFTVTDGTNDLLDITAGTGGDTATFDNLATFVVTAEAVDITASTTDIDLVAGTSIDLSAGTEVTILSGGTSDVDITAARDIDMAGECLRFDAPSNYGHHHWATDFHMFGDDASSQENYLTINASPVPSTTLAGGIVVVTNANTFTPGETITGSNAISGADAFFDVSGVATPGVAVGDFIVAEGCSPECLNGLWQVTARSTNVIEVAGFTVSPIDGMFKTDMPTDATATGSLYKADICVLRCDGGGWEVADGDSTSALTYSAIGAGSTTLQDAYAAGSNIVVSSGNTPLTMTGTVNDATNVLELAAGNHTAGTAGSVLTVTDDASSSGIMASFTSAGSGTGVDILQTGSGDLLVARTASQTLLEVDGLGQVLITPLAAQDFTATMLTTGNFDVDVATGSVTFDASGAGSTFSSDGFESGNTGFSAATSGDQAYAVTMTQTGQGAGNITIDAVNSNATAGNANVEVNASSTVGTASISLANDANAQTVNIGTGGAAMAVNVATGGTASAVTVGTGAAHTVTVGDTGNTGAVQLNSASAVGFDVGGTVLIDMGTDGTTATTDWVVTFPTKNIMQASALDVNANTKNGILNINSSNMNYGNGAAEGNLYGVYGGGNEGYTSTTGTTAGHVFVVNTVAASITNSVAFTAGVSATSNATLEVTSGDGSNFSASDIIIVSGSTDPENDGIYEMLSEASDVLTLRGMLTANVEAFTQAQVFTNAADTAATVAVVNLTVFRNNASGALEFQENFSTTGGTYTSVGGSSTLSSAYTTPGTTPATMGSSFEAQVPDSTIMEWTTAASATLVQIAPAAAGDNVTLGFGAGASGGDTINVNSETFDVTSDNNSFTTGASFDDGAAGTEIYVGLNATGGVANAITATGGTLTVQSTNVNSTVTVATAAGDAVFGAGDINVIAGNGDSNPTSGGTVNVTGGSVTTGSDSIGVAPGNVEITAGSDVNGVLTLGGGNVLVTAGDGLVGGTVAILAGDDSGGGSGGGPVTVTSGGGSSSAGGAITTLTGNGAGGNAAGAMTFTIGTSNAVAGPAMTFNGGAGNGSGNDGGDFVFNCAAPSTAGTAAAGKLTVNLQDAQGVDDASFVDIVTETGMAESDHFIQFDSSASTNGGIFQMFGGDVTPTHSGAPGSFYQKQTAAVAGSAFVNTTVGVAEGTTWSRLLTEADNPVTFSKTVAVTTGAVTANTNVTATGGGANLDASLGDYSGVTFISEVNVYWNGVLQRNGADASANFDVYPGTTPANGDLAFEFALRSGDTITMVIFSAL